MNIEIKYNGSYPNLCSGELIVIIDSKEYKFPNYCLSSGGSAYFTGDWDDIIEYGKWSISKWPENFPENLKDPVLEKVNDEIPWGCCGGCL